MHRTRGIRTAYSSVHRALTWERGKAADYPCLVCCGTAQDWAYTYSDPCPDERADSRGIKWSPNLDKYVPLCKSCHAYYDREQITHCPQGHEYTEETSLLDAGYRKCKICVYARNRKAGDKKRRAMGKRIYATKQAVQQQDKQPEDTRTPSGRKLPY